jgi:aspartyl-tRNA(Asn)/glutamyl-tRNA(Gln) amidotransferase subunit A
VELLNWSLREISTAVKNKKISAKEVTTYFQQRIKKFDSKYNSFVTHNEQALQAADLVDQKIQRGEDPGFLSGVPVAIKDLFCTRGLRTTAASKILYNFVPPYTATCVQRLQDQGAIVLGKTNMDEFAMGSSNETSSFGTCHNPWNSDYVAGGSSGGSAAAVAASLAPASLGSDTGGSIRQPAAFCGLTGVKPTYGRISRYGMVAFASSLDQAGPMAKSVDDCIFLLDAMCGHDTKDSTTSQRPWERLSSKQNLKSYKFKVGLPKEYFEHNIEESVIKAFWQTVENLKKQGVEFVDVKLPHTPYAVPVYYMVATSEASSNLSRYDGIRYGYRAEPPNKDWGSLDELYSTTRAEGFGAEVKRRIILGTFALSSGYYEAYYAKASRVRRLIQKDFLDAFQDCDLIMGPVTTSPAFKTGTRINSPLQMYLNDIFTTSINLAGLPAMTVPVGLNSQGLPVGVQIMAPHFAEANMLSLAQGIEDVSDMKGKVPHGLS